MAKNPILLTVDLRPERRRSKVLPIASIFVLASLLTPLVIEVVALCHAQWCEVLGTSVTARTPTLDSIGDRIQEVREECWSCISSRFQRVPWNPRVVLPVLVVVMALGMVMLRF
jgi:hypothetical protein